MNVLIVDDHPLIHEIVGGVVRAAFDDCDVRAAADLASALSALDSGDAPDLILLDLYLPDSAPTDTLRRIRARYPEVPIVVLSADNTRDMIHSALKNGAAGYLPKSLKPAIMVAALRLVDSGGVYVPAEAVMDEDIESAASAGNELNLTNRQKEILRLIARGHDNRSIAAHLGISEGTVKQHVHALFIALGISSRAQAVRAAFLYGIGDD